MRKARQELRRPRRCTPKPLKSVIVWALRGFSVTETRAFREEHLAIIEGQALARGRIIAKTGYDNTVRPAFAAKSTPAASNKNRQRPPGLTPETAKTNAALEKRNGINTMKIAYFDCFSGISGDMTLGALLDCGADEARFREQIASLQVPGYALTVRKVTRQGITATDVDVRLAEAEQGHGRHLADIAAILKSSGLSSRVQQKALAVFTRLADAEAEIHGTSREEIHFHEVGAVDAIVDIVGACVLLDMLDVDCVAVSSLPCGYGTITCRHGIMPVPAPATLKLLSGFPVHAVNIKGEVVTPTGAALVTTLADPKDAGHMPAMRVLFSGFGAGKKQFVPDMPNLLRVVIGETVDSPDPTLQTITVMETNLDDQNPETFELLMERCFAAGALDVFYTPIQMKKNRPATLVTLLCPTDKAGRLADVLFREGGTFGIRTREQARLTLERSWQTVTTSFGDIRVKIGQRRGEVITAAPEYEDCKAAAVAHAVPVQAVYRAALCAYDRVPRPPCL